MDLERNFRRIHILRVSANGVYIYTYITVYNALKMSVTQFACIAWNKTENCTQLSHICTCGTSKQTHTHNAYAQLFLNYSLVIKYFIYVLFVVIVDRIQLLVVAHIAFNEREGEKKNETKQNNKIYNRTTNDMVQLRKFI